jgi:gliding motility-associated-like protein
VPTAFTPNNDGSNDILKPIPIGIDRLDYFCIYNRYGQIIYSTGDAGAGWDGTRKGELQSSGSYVFAAQGKDYKGRKILKKGTVFLIR